MGVGGRKGGSTGVGGEAGGGGVLAVVELGDFAAFDVDVVAEDDGLGG